MTLHSQIIEVIIFPAHLHVGRYTDPDEKKSC